MTRSDDLGQLFCRLGTVIMIGALLAVGVGSGWAVIAGDDFASSSRGIRAAFHGALAFLLGGIVYAVGHLIRR